MGLDPNDLRLNIEAQVTAPGAVEAAAQIREAGRAADEARIQFDRLREVAGGQASAATGSAFRFNAPTPSGDVAVRPGPGPAATSSQAAQQQGAVALAPAPPTVEQPVRQRVVEAPPPPLPVVQLVRQATEVAPPPVLPDQQQSVTQVLRAAPEPVAPRALEQPVQQVTRPGTPAAPPDPITQTVQQTVQAAASAPALPSQEQLVNQRIVGESPVVQDLTQTVAQVTREAPETIAPRQLEQPVQQVTRLAPGAAPAPQVADLAPPPANPFALHTEPGPGRVPVNEEDIAAHLEGLAGRYESNVGRIKHLENVAEAGTGAKVERPPWAVGFTNEAVRQMATDHGQHASQPLWWERAGLETGSGEVRENIRQGTQYRGARFRPQQSSAEAQAEMARLTHENEQLLAATEVPEGARTLYREPLPQAPDDLPWEAPNVRQRRTAEPARAAESVGARADQASPGTAEADARGRVAAPPEPAPEPERPALAPTPAIAPVAPSPSQYSRFYHGTGAAFDAPDLHRLDPHSLFGRAHYVTDDPRVASSYANQGTDEIAGLRQRLSTGLSDRQSYVVEQRIARLEEQQQAAGSGPNVRAVDVPQNLNLLNAEQPVTPEQVRSVRDAIPEGRARDFFAAKALQNDEGTATSLTSGEELYHKTRSAAALLPDEWTGGDIGAGDLRPSGDVANDILARAGFHGIQYAGGRRSPIQDESGQDIQHTAVALFPNALPQIRNAVAGRPESHVAPPPAPQPEQAVAAPAPEPAAVEQPAPVPPQEAPAARAPTPAEPQPQPNLLNTEETFPFDRARQIVMRAGGLANRAPLPKSWLAEPITGQHIVDVLGGGEAARAGLTQAGFHGIQQGAESTLFPQPEPVAPPAAPPPSPPPTASAAAAPEPEDSAQATGQPAPVRVAPRQADVRALMDSMGTSGQRGYRQAASLLAATAPPAPVAAPAPAPTPLAAVPAPPAPPAAPPPPTPPEPVAIPLAAAAAPAPAPPAAPPPPSPPVLGAPAAPEPEDAAAAQRPTEAPGVAFANQLVRALVEEQGATAAAFRGAVETVRASTKVAPTITPADLGIDTPAPATSATGARAGDHPTGAPGSRRASRSIERPESAGGAEGAEGSSVQSERATARAERTPRQRAQRGSPSAVGQADDPAEGINRTRTAAEGLDEPIQRASRGAGGLLSIFNLSTPSITRASLALFGVGAGLNALVTLARRVHEEIAAAIDAQVELTQRSREVRANYGPQQGAQLQAQATAFTAKPGTVGSEREYLSATSSLHGLASEYALNTDQIDRLVTSAGTLARIHGTELGPAVQAVQGVLRGNVDAAQAYGISLTDEEGRIRGVGATQEQLVRTLGAARAEQVRYQMVMAQVATQEANSVTAFDSTASALDRLQKASERARQDLVHLIEKPFNVIVNIAANGIEAIPAAIGRVAASARAGATNTPAPPDPVSQGVAAAVSNSPIPGAMEGLQTIGGAVSGVADWASRLDFSGRFPRLRPAQAEAAPPAPQPDAASAGVDEAAARANTIVAESAKAATDALAAESSAFERISLHVQGDLIPALERLSATQQAIAGLGAIGQALGGPDVALTGGDIPRRAAAQAAQDVFAQRRQQQAQELDPIVAEAQQAAPDEFARRQPARQQELQAGQAQVFASRAQAEAQAPVTALSLVDRQRELQSAQALADVRTGMLNREGGMVDLQRQEADLADRMRVASRENLDILQQQTSARLASLDASNRLNDLQYQERRGATEIQAIRADVRRGALDPSALQAIPGLRQERRAIRLAEPRAELNALEGQRPVELAQRAATADELARTERTIPLQQQQRGLEDQLTPLQEVQRLDQEHSDAISRQLELAQLAETAERTGAEASVIGAQAVSLAADAAVRAAEQWAANINNGLTDLQRAQALLGGLATPPGPTQTAAPADTTNPTPDRQRDPSPPQPPTPPPSDVQTSLAGLLDRLNGTQSIMSPAAQQAAGGAGAQAAGTSTSVDTQTNYITVTVPNTNANPNDIARAVVAALNGRATRAPQATPRTLVGAR